ncbi:phage terminase large subunit family protein, partial [Escherichia coli]|nr:phage terminase large subunit family protein [Escherichia coli]
FRVSPEVVSRLSPNKNDNNVYDRTFLAGNYLKIGWPSVNIMSSSDYKCVALTQGSIYMLNNEITLRKIEIFLSYMESMNISKTAEAMNISAV